MTFGQAGASDLMRCVTATLGRALGYRATYFLTLSAALLAALR
jgi:hypothetical protein